MTHRVSRNLLWDFRHVDCSESVPSPETREVRDRLRYSTSTAQLLN
jgi:hypothetical protein